MKNQIRGIPAQAKLKSTNIIMLPDPGMNKDNGQVLINSIHNDLLFISPLDVTDSIKEIGDDFGVDAKDNFMLQEGPKKKKTEYRNFEKFNKARYQR